MMKLTPPKQVVFWVSVLLAGLGLLATIGVLSALSGSAAFWLAFGGWLLLAAGNAVKGF
jgi:hypothetical protein